MVKVRRRNSARRSRRRPMRTMAKLLHHSISRQPLPCRVPADPPPLKRFLDCSIILPINFQYITQTTGSSWDFGNISQIPVRYVTINEHGYLVPFQINVSEIGDVLRSVIGTCNSQCWLEFSVLKIQVWGPLSTQYRQSTIQLRVDVGSNSNSLFVHDIGTQTRRPRCGITLPYRVWYCSNSTETILDLNLDSVAPFTTKDLRWDNTKDTDIGVMYISLHYRVSPLNAGSLPSVAENARTETSSVPTRHHKNRHNNL